MLAAVEGDHLARHRRRQIQEADRGGDLIGAGAALQWHGGCLRFEIGGGLMHALKQWAWADGVHPDARRETLGKGLRHAP
jgi:hypothetical protein